jgi:hypothetical protein
MSLWTILCLVATVAAAVVAFLAGHHDRALLYVVLGYLIRIDSKVK